MSAGAVVAVNHAGAVVVNRGLLRGQQVEKLRDKRRAFVGSAVGAGGASEAEPVRAALSEKLVRRLSAHRTAALQAEVARHPQVALAALVHHQARRVLSIGYEGSPININATSHVDGLVKHAADMADALAATGLREVREAWADRLPSESEAMFAELLVMTQSEALSLLAVCVASTTTAICSRETETPASMLAQAVGLDMHTWWRPTAVGYFEHVSKAKAKALEAVTVVAPDQVARLSKLKKGDLASEAERLVAGSGWLPAMLCTVERDAEPASDPAAAGASGDAPVGEREDDDVTA